MSHHVTLLLMVGLLALPASAARADEGLEERMSDGAEARYSGQELVVCWWGSREVAEVYQVQQSDGAALVRHGRGEAMVVPGAVMGGEAEAGWLRVEVGAPSWTLHERYRVVTGGRKTHMGRSVEPVEVWEGDLLRARFVFDRETSVPLTTTVFDLSGRPFRMSDFTDFTTRAPKLLPAPRSVGLVMEEAEAATLTDELFGYRLAGSYVGPHDGVHAYYSDGLFSFSIFEVSSGFAASELPESSDLDVDGLHYRLRVRPAEVWVLWSGDEHAYVLVGDLPPDHLHEVLAELPGPEPPGLLRRLRQALFGG